MKELIAKLWKKLRPYDLRTEGAKWVKENIGEEYVSDFLEKYDNICQGVPIGGFYETAVFLDMIETIKEETK